MTHEYRSVLGDRAVLPSFGSQSDGDGCDIKRKGIQMNKKILVVGLACLSAVGVAQSDGSQQKSASPAASSQQVTSPRDAATGQASGKRMHKPMTVTSEDATAVRESPSKASIGKTSVRVAAGDVDGDGRPDVAASSSVKSPRDAATGQASGKRTASGNDQSRSQTQPNK